MNYCFAIAIANGFLYHQLVPESKNQRHLGPRPKAQPCTSVYRTVERRLAR